MCFLFCFELFEQCQRPVTEERQGRRQGITVCRPSREINGFFGISQALVGDRRPIQCRWLKLTGLRQLGCRGLIVPVRAGKIAVELMNPAAIEVLYR